MEKNSCFSSFFSALVRTILGTSAGILCCIQGTSIVVLDGFYSGNNVGFVLIIKG